MDISTRYQAVLDSAADVASALLDMEGGRFILAVIREVLQNLLDDENFSGASILIHALCESTFVPFDFDPFPPADIALRVWSDTLSNVFEEIGINTL